MPSFRFQKKHRAPSRCLIVRLTPLLAVSVAALSSCNVFAEEKTLQTLKKVVVSAAGFEQKITDAPASISLITQEDLASKPYSSLADALRDVEGIDVGSSLDKNGNISISLRGLPADYTLVLIDGKRQSDVGDIGPNNFGNSQFMYMPPLSAIERIEVVRGPMSTLYGADAMGGVINIITRKVPDSWSGSLTSSLNLQEDSQYGDDKKTDFYAAGPLIKGVLGMALRGNLYDREQSNPGYSHSLPLPATDVSGNANEAIWKDEGSFGDKKMVAAQNWNLGTTLNWTPSAAHELGLSYDISKQRYDNTQGQTGTLDGVESLWRASNANIIQPRVGYTPYQRVEREQVSLTHNGRYDFGEWETSLTTNRSENLGRSLPLTVQERGQLQTLWNQARVDQGLTGNAKPALTPALAAQLEAQFLPRQLRTLKISSNTIDTKLDTNMGKQHALTLGAQLFDAEMEDGVFGMNGAGFEDGTAQKHRQMAIFAEDHWSLTDSLTATLGARYDDHNIYGGNTSPRAYLVWQNNANWTFKGGVSSGYKTPKPNQLFAGITGFGGQGVNPFVGTPSLQVETSTNYEVATYYDNLSGFSANATVFFSDFKDKIASADNVPNCYDANDVKTLNSDCVDIGPGWAGLGFQSFSQNTNIDKVETSGLELGARYDINRAWTLHGNYTYTKSEQKSGADEGLPLVNTPKNMVNATLNWLASEHLTLSLIAELRDERFNNVTTNGVTNERTENYYKAYELYHLGARFKASDSVTLNARVNNLLDDDLSSITYSLNEQQDGYNRQPDYNTTEKARSFWLSADVTF